MWVRLRWCLLTDAFGVAGMRVWLRYEERAVGRGAAVPSTRRLEWKAMNLDYKHVNTVAQARPDCKVLSNSKCRVQRALTGSFAGGMSFELSEIVDQSPIRNLLGGRRRLPVGQINIFGFRSASGRSCSLGSPSAVWCRRRKLPDRSALSVW